MSEALVGSRARIERAFNHVDELDATLNRYARQGSFVIRAEHDEQTDEYVVRMYSERQPPVPPPLSASVMVGDCLNNLRSALDYVVWGLAKSPSKDNQFPLYQTPDNWSQWHARRLATVPAELWPMFERLQPYPDRVEVRALAVLATLNDADKHRLLLPGAVASAGHKGKFTISGLDSIEVSGRDWVPFEDGAEVYRLRLVPHGGSKADVKAEIPYSIIFRDPDTGTAVTIFDLRRVVLAVSNVVESFSPHVS